MVNIFTIIILATGESTDIAILLMILIHHYRMWICLQRNVLYIHSMYHNQKRVDRIQLTVFTPVIHFGEIGCGLFLICIASESSIIVSAIYFLGYAFTV